MSEKQLITTLKSAGEHFFEQLNELKKNVPNLPTDKLAEGYKMLKPYEKAVTEFTKTVRNELIENRFKEIIPDEKGHKYISIPSGGRLKAEKRVKYELDQEKAIKYLRKKGLYDKATTVTRTITDVEGLISLVVTMLNTLKEFGCENVKELSSEFESYIATEVTVDEAKLEALVTLGELSADDLAEFYTEKISYALKVLKSR